MNSQSGTGSSASAHTNPFLETSAGSNQYTSDVPLNRNDNGAIGSALDNLSNSASTTTSNDPATQGQQAANQAIRDIKGSLASLTDGQTKPNLAGNLAPSKETMSPDSAPEGTEHVSNILSGIGGALLSAPAAALEAVSPVAASKVSDAASVIAAKMPALHLDEAAAKAQGLANAAYSKLPAGTADTIKGYVGAAQAKANEILPPALGGSPTHGNTGSGELAKPPSQLASEYGTAAKDSLNSAAVQAQNLANQAVGATKETASNAAAVTQQKASAASSIAEEKASQAASATQQTAQDVSNRVSANASYASERASEIGNDAYNKSAATASDATSRAADQAQYSQQSAGQLLNQAAAGNTMETHAANHPTTSTGAELYPRGSNNPYSDRSN